MRTLRWTIGIALLLAQVGAVVYARFVPTRYFCWAPYDMQTDYRLDVTVNGRKLSAGEIRQRYRRGPTGTDNRSYAHLSDIIEQAERRYHAHDRVHVVMTYSVNGIPREPWHYRQP